MSRLIAFAARHQRAGQITTFLSFGACFLSLPLHAVVPRIALVVLLGASLSLAMFAWGMVCLGAWFGPDKRDLPRRSGGIRGFAARAFDVWAALFLVGWFGIATTFAVVAILALFG